jgi:hypothetical protein
MKEKNIKNLMKISMVFFVLGAVGSILVMRTEWFPALVMDRGYPKGLFFLMGGIHLFVCAVGILSEVVLWQTLKMENDSLKKAVVIGEIMIHGCIILEYLVLYELVIPVFCAIFYLIYILCMISYLKKIYSNEKVSCS